MTSRSAAAGTEDPIDRLAGLEPGGSTAALRRRREAAHATWPVCFDTLFATTAPVPELSALERELMALRVAALLGDEALTALHRERAQAQGATAGMIGRVSPAGDSDTVSALNMRMTAMVGLVDRLNLKPAAATREHLNQLLRMGFSVPAVVTLVHIVGWVNALARLLAGLRAIEAAGARSGPAAHAVGGDATIAGRHRGAPPPPQHGRFTLDAQDWSAWLPLPDTTQCSAEQRALLLASDGARPSPLRLTLLYHPPMQRRRAYLMHAVMAEAGGLSRTDRELVAAAVARLNACTYSASLHGRRFVRLTRQHEVMGTLFAQGVNVPLPRQRRAIVDLAADLSAQTPAVGEQRVAALRDTGVDELAILDTVQAAALAAWDNRLMLALGEPVAAEQP